MLKRIPATRTILNDPKNKKHKKVIVDAIRVQKPFLEARMNIRMKTPFKVVRANLYEIAGAGRVSGKEVPIPTSPDGSFLSFCLDVSEGWDQTKKTAREKYGVPFPWSDPRRSESLFFCNRALMGATGGYRNIGMGSVFAPLRKQSLGISLLSSVQQHMRGDDNFESVAELFKEVSGGATLEKVEKTDAGVVLLGNGAKMIYPHNSIKAKLAHLYAKRAINLNILAVKMSLGFNDELWPRHGEVLDESCQVRPEKG